MNNASNTKEAKEECRQFYRIDDYIEISYRHVIDNELQAPNYEYDILANNQHHDLLHAMAALNRDMQELNTKVVEINTVIANYLKLLNHKINLLTKTIIAHPDQNHIRPQFVNISEGGIAFGTTELLHINDELRVKLILQPIFNEMAIYTKVTRIELRDEAKKFDPNFPYWVAMYYTHIQSNDRQLLARYILQKQTRKCQETSGG